MESRIRLARGDGHLTGSERDCLLENSLFARRGTDGRRGQVCAIVGRAQFDDDPTSVDLLLSTWGGEATYWMRLNKPALQRLRLLGKPSLVVVRLHLAALSAPPRFGPPLARLFVGRLLEFPETHGDVFYRESVKPHDIEAIWQPGDQEYDRHSQLPHN